VTDLYCRYNAIKSSDYLMSLGYIKGDIEIDINIIYKNRFNYGMTIMYKIFRQNSASKIQKKWQKYWYDELILIDNTMMNRFVLDSWKRMN